ncbi:GGDEF domain-containing protein [Roseateles oligotrophus]|uniref:diguanylate cyclase n=1 Tax=Roseateles oligotrophus TaxID=1769250 RepID=A0ABT2YHR6_9BURK|nr:GGDEF domain-containing protein [Roseateles oligotrophus]MCV2369526.1 GGDEF domain-containing protein [Roseateles oligotrophus]
MLTLLALYANEHWMTRTLRIDAASHPADLVKAVNDSIDGGLSEGRLERRGNGWILHCEIRPGYEWPFCDLQVRLAELGRGVDLTQFDSVRLWVRASGPEPVQHVRVFLRHFDPAYSNSGKEADMKPHEVVFAPSAESVPVEFRLAQFMVASWWVQEHPLPVHLLGPQLDNTVLLSLTTSGLVTPGAHKIELDAIEFVGVWVDPATFRLAIIAVWFACMGAFLFWDWRRSRLRLGRTLRHKRELQQANARLVVRSGEYEAKAHHDPLTGVSNRLGLKHDLNLLMRAQEEQMFPLAVVFADIDHFKSINDSLGHDAGDEVLKQFAQHLKANIQREDLLARWGGEEFVLLMPLTRAEEAVAVAERLRLMLTEQAWSGGIKVTASFGVAQATRHSEGEAGIEAAMRAADQAMYKAKREGRNRVECNFKDLGKEA